MVDSHIGGWAVVKETLHLVFKYPIVMVYALFLFVLNFVFHGIVFNYCLGNILLEVGGFVCMMLISFCITRHTLRVLCKQPVTLVESISWVARHTQQIAAWVLISGIVSLVLHLLFVVVALIVALVGMNSDCSSILSTFLVVFGAALAAVSLVIVVMMMSGTPIVVAEQLSVRMTFNQIRYLWHKAGRSYVFAAIIVALLALLVCTLMMTGVQLILSDPDNAGCVCDLAPLFIFFITIANTLLYYHLYYKHERELAQDLSNA